MNCREVTADDIGLLHAIRMAVKENRLSDPSLISKQQYYDFITSYGKGWLSEEGGKVVGFAIIDERLNNIWALFVHPDHEGRGAGKMLHERMVDWHFTQKRDTLWLTTAPQTRAQKLYTTAGWKTMGAAANGDIRFEMSWYDWRNKPM